MSDLLEGASRALGRSGASASSLRIARTLSTHTRSEVSVLITPSNERLIVKRFREEDAELRFEAEMTALEALEARPLSPLAHLLGSDRKSLILVMEYVGDTSIEDLIQGREARPAESALLGYASAIGRLHRAGSGVLRALQLRREASGYPDSRSWPPFARDRQASGLATYTSASAELVTSEITAVVAETFAGEHEGRTLIQWDSWPGNSIARGEQTFLVDLENSMSGNPSIDVASWHLLFPAAPHRLPLPGGIPAQLVTRMDAAYANANGQEIDPRALAFGVASRMLFEVTASGAQKLAAGTLDRRIRLLYACRLEIAAEVLGRAAVLPALRDAMSAMAARARGVDLANAEIPAYPALRGYPTA
jgi:hypothetical protein